MEKSGQVDGRKSSIGEAGEGVRTDEKRGDGGGSRRWGR